MSPCKRGSLPHRRHRPGGRYAIDAEAATKRHFLHSYNVVHMPQGCGCVMGVPPHAGGTDLVYCNTLTRLLAGLGPPYGKTEPIGRQGYTNGFLPVSWHWPAA
jgi:hypothetical protein